MAAVAGLAAMLKRQGRLWCVFAGLRKTPCAPGAVASQRRECSAQSQEVPSKADMPVAMENPYKEPPKKCILCGTTLDYKNVQLLSQFISPYTGKILGRHITGLCEKKQSELTKTIKRARKTGFMSVTYKDPTFLSDPKICNIKYPE